MKGKSELFSREEGIVLSAKQMSANSDPDGGYLVVPELSSRMSTRIFETSPVRQVATVETISTSELEIIIDDDEASSGWVHETGTRSETDTPEIGKKTIPTNEVYAEPKTTVKFLNDAYVDVESWLANKVSDKLARTENTAFVTGDGNVKPRGFTTYDAWASAGVYERNKIEQVNSGTSGAVTADGAISLQNSLLEAYQARASWMMERDTYTDFLQLKATDNQYLFGFEFLKNGQATPTLLGRRVNFADDMPSVGANALSVAYGDFSAAYTIVDRMGLTVLRDPYTTKGFVKFYTTKFVGGDVVNFQALKLMKLA